MMIWAMILKKGELLKCHIHPAVYYFDSLAALFSINME